MSAWTCRQLTARPPTRDIRYGFEIPYDDVWHVMCLAFGWALKTNGCCGEAEPTQARTALTEARPTAAGSGAPSLQCLAAHAGVV
jgi:hypothetical protein